MRALIADDSTIIRRIQKRLLETMGATEIAEAASGLEVLRMLTERDYDFDLVLCDVNMPEMGGIDVLDAIRAHPKGRGLPVIMCTCVAERALVMRALKAGANHYIIKPFDIKTLRSRIEAVMAPMVQAAAETDQTDAV